MQATELFPDSPLTSLQDWQLLDICDLKIHVNTFCVGWENVHNFI